MYSQETGTTRRVTIGARTRAGLLSAVLVTPVALGAGAASAQTASQITPPSFRPPPQADPAAIVIPDKPGLDVPAGADKLSVRLRGVEVEGGLPPLAAATQAITAGLTNRVVTAAEIFAAARALENAYAQAGYGLVRVVLPAQRIVDGASLRLVVVDGFIERIETKDVPPMVRRRIDALLAPLVGQRGVALSQIERQLLLAGDVPGTILRSTLAAGSAPGSSVLVIEARHRPVSGHIVADNTLSSGLGHWSIGVGAELNSVAGLGELIYFRTSGYPKGGDHGFFASRPLNRTLAGGVVVPLGIDGLTFNLEATDVHATPRPPAGGLGFTSAFSRLSARLRYPWIRSRELTVNSELAFDAQNERVSIIKPTTLRMSLDRLRIVRGTGDVFWLTPWGGQVSGRVTTSFGINGIGARSAKEATPLLPLSRQGADADFSKLDVALSYSQQVVEHLAVDLKFRAQTSFGKPLLRSEQIGLSSLSALSSFDSGTFQGDAGYVVRAEISSPWRFDIPAAAVGITPYVFGAFGMVRLERPTALERATTRGASYGLGLKLGGIPTDGSLGVSNTSFTLEWGRQHRNDHAPTEDRIVFSAIIQF